MAIETALPDCELVALARKGREDVIAELFARHEAWVRRVASSYRRADDPDDLVSDAFARILAAIKRGAGPRGECFRTYLLVVLRRLAAERIASTHDFPDGEVPIPLQLCVWVEPLDPTERELVLSAFESLPGRVQAVLWLTAVDGHPPREMASAFGMSANAVSALAYRAREKLRQAYLQAHLQASPRPECEPHRLRLGAYVRDGLGARERMATQVHIGGCDTCRAALVELCEINSSLPR